MKAITSKLTATTIMLCLLLSATACGQGSTSEAPSSQITDGNAAAATTTAATTTPAYETSYPVYPEEINIHLPQLLETPKLILSLENDRVLGAATMVSVAESGKNIESYGDLQKVFGATEGLDEAFFETHALRPVHSAQSSGSTRYAVGSVTVTDGKLTVEIIEQHAAMATRDLRQWTVYAAVEKAHTEAPAEVKVTSIQLAE